MEIIDEILYRLKVRIPSKFIFASLGLIQAAFFYLVDQGSIPEFFFKIHTDKILITFSILVMTCYNGKKKFTLLFTSAISCLLIFIPISSYNHIEIVHAEVSHAATIYTILLFLYPIVYSMTYYYHTYGIKLTNVGNQAYLSFWTPIIKAVTVIFYFIISTLLIFIFTFVTSLTGFEYIWKEIFNITLIKAYIPIAYSFFYWIVYKHPDTTENVIRGSAYLASHLYWLIAPLGLIFIVSDAISTVIHGKLPDIDYRILFSICLVSVLTFQLANYPDENEAKTNIILEKIIYIYNCLLPLIPITYFYHILTDFKESSGDLLCNESLLQTGLNWGNFAPTLACVSLIYLTSIQAYYVNKNKFVMQQRLAIDSWWICIFYTIVCLIAFNPYFNLNPQSSYYFEHCHHFKEHSKFEHRNYIEIDSQTIYRA